MVTDKEPFGKTVAQQIWLATAYEARESTWDAANVAPIRYALEDAFNNFEGATSTETVVLAIHNATRHVVDEAMREFMKEVG